MFVVPTKCFILNLVFTWLSFVRNNFVLSIFSWVFLNILMHWDQSSVSDYICKYLPVPDCIWLYLPVFDCIWLYLISWLYLNSCLYLPVFSAQAEYRLTLTTYLDQITCIWLYLPVSAFICLYLTVFACIWLYFLSRQNTDSPSPPTGNRLPFQDTFPNGDQHPSGQRH